MIDLIDSPDTISFFPSEPCGTVTAPPSKSLTHRALLCAALADGESVIENVAPSEDVRATVDCLRSLGAAIDASADPTRRGDSRIARNPTRRGDSRIARNPTRRGEQCSPGDSTLTVRGFDPFSSRSAVLPCHESGSTLRFLLPLCLLSGQPFTLTGTPRLLARPLSVCETLCRERGFRFDRAETSLTVCGKLRPGRFAIPGDVSSQFASGLLFALPLLDGDSELRLQPPVVSRPYLDLTLATLAEFGIQIRKKAGDLYEIPGKQHYSAKNAVIEGDWSNAAPFFVLRALGCDVTVNGLDPASLQGDRVCVAQLDALRQGFAALDLSDCPDLGPSLFVAAALLHGGCFTGIRRLRDKESDRVAAMRTELETCGAVLHVEDNRLTVTPAPLHAPTVPLSSHNDHRVAMALSILLLRTGGTLTGADAVAKSWPDFYSALGQLGAEMRFPI